MARPRPARTRILLVVALGLLLTAAGCASRGQGQSGLADGGDASVNSGTASDRAVSAPMGADCESGADGTATTPPLTPLPAGTVLVSASRCLFDAQPVPGDGEWLVRTEQNATTGLDGLAAALRLPSEKPTDGQTCDLVGYIPIVITVTDDTGRRIHPEVPHTACGAPLKATTDAIAGLSWSTVGTTKVRQVRTELEVSSGCYGAYKPIIAVMAADGGGSGTQTATLDTTARPLQVCRYELDPDPANQITVNGIALRMGHLASASTLDASAAHELLTVLNGAPRAGACTSNEQPFAVVHPVDGDGPWLTIERGGCVRAMLDTENYLRQLNAATVTRLIG